MQTNQRQSPEALNGEQRIFKVLVVFLVLVGSRSELVQAFKFSVLYPPENSTAGNSEFETVEVDMLNLMREHLMFPWEMELQWSRFVEINAITLLRIA